MVVIGQKWLYSGKTCLLRARMVVFGLMGCNRARVILFGRKWLDSGKVVVFG